jgi:uncharacterized protein (TIGR02646 family)
MRPIKKRRLEPQSLIERRASAGSYAGFDISELRDYLVEEQRGLCCYCMQRIYPSSESMNVEHWSPQSKSPERQLDYTNLLASCKGNKGKPRDYQYCDNRKGDDLLSRNPADPQHRVGDFLEFWSDGRIASKDKTFDHELNHVLNLNLRHLQNNRRAVLDAFKRQLDRFSGGVTQGQIERWLGEWSGDSVAGPLPEYCEVVVYWLRKRLKR